MVKYQIYIKVFMGFSYNFMVVFFLLNFFCGCWSFHIIKLYVWL